jgi:hypothetical protein
MPAMLLGSFDQINLEITIATLEAFSKRGFCGDLSFTVRNRQPFRVVSEVHHPDPKNPPDWHAIVDETRPIIKQWLGLSDTVLTVRFNEGRINRIQLRDHTTGVEAIS